jgi:hypothetical protein
MNYSFSVFLDARALPFDGSGFGFQSCRLHHPKHTQLSGR